MVHRFGSSLARNPAIYRFPTQTDVSQNGIPGPRTIHFPIPVKPGGAHHLDKLRQRHDVQKGAFVLRKSTTRYWMLSEILLWFG